MSSIDSYHGLCFMNFQESEPNSPQYEHGKQFNSRWILWCICIVIYLVHFLFLASQWEDDLHPYRMHINSHQRPLTTAPPLLNAQPWSHHNCPPRSKLAASETSTVETTVVSSVKCYCCTLIEECMPPYIDCLRERYKGRWICGLCAEAVEAVFTETLAACSRASALRRNHYTRVRRQFFWVVWAAAPTRTGIRSFVENGGLEYAGNSGHGGGFIFNCCGEWLLMGVF